MSRWEERWAKIVGLVLPTDSEGRILLARLTYGPEVWAMVGGVAEPGESPDEAARREALEEAGLKVTTERLLAVCDRGQVILFIFEGRVIGGALTPQVEEIAELRWFTPDEIASVPVYEVIRRLAREMRLGQRRGLVPMDLDWPDGPPTPAYLPR